MTKIESKGIELNRAEVTYFEFGFAESTPRTASTYSLESPYDEFIERLNPIYSDCIDELKRDDKIVGRFQPSYPGAKKYPTLEQFLALGGEHWMEFVDTFLKFDILSLFFREGELNYRYRIVSVDTCEYRDSTVTITGKIVHRKELDPAYGSY